jgi:hypothetical protein
MNYPERPTENDKIAYKTFFVSIGNILPCDICRKHYKEHSEKFPIDYALENRRALVQWLIDIHNEANKSLGKQVWTYDQVISYYKKLYSGSIEVSPSIPVKKVIKPEQNNQSNNLESYLYILNISIIAVIVFYLLWKKL